MFSDTFAQHFDLASKREEIHPISILGKLYGNQQFNLPYIYTEKNSERKPHIASTFNTLLMKEVHQLEIIQSNPQQYSQIHSQYNQSLFTHHHWIESISNENTEPIYWLIKKDGEIVAKIAGLSVQGSWLRG